MAYVHARALARNSLSNIIRLTRPRIEAARDCDGWYVLRGDHGWLCGDRRQAISQFDELEAGEQFGCFY
jgi:hypothetical protein